MSILRINVVADLSQMINLRRYTNEHKDILLRVAAQTYLNFLRQSYLVRSGGGKGWASLKKSTIRSKRSRGIAENPSAIMRESDLLYTMLDKQVTPTKVFVGYIRNRSHSRGSKTVFELVKIHATGAAKNLSVRSIIELPDGRTRNRMINDIKQEYDKILRANQRRRRR